MLQGRLLQGQLLPRPAAHSLAGAAVEGGAALGGAEQGIRRCQGRDAAVRAQSRRRQLGGLDDVDVVDLQGTAIRA